MIAYGTSEAKFFEVGGLRQNYVKIPPGLPPVTRSYVVREPEMRKLSDHTDLVKNF